AAAAAAAAVSKAEAASSPSVNPELSPPVKMEVDEQLIVNTRYGRVGAAADERQEPVEVVSVRTGSPSGCESLEAEEQEQKQEQVQGQEQGQQEQGCQSGQQERRADGDVLRTEVDVLQQQQDQPGQESDMRNGPPESLRRQQQLKTEEEAETTPTPTIQQQQQQQQLKMQGIDSSVERRHTHQQQGKAQDQTQEEQQREEQEVPEPGTILFPSDGGVLGAEVRRQLEAAPDMTARHAVMDVALRQVDGTLGDMAGVLGVDSMGARVRGLWSTEAEAAFAGLMGQRDTKLGHLIRGAHRSSLQHDATGVVSYYYNAWKTRATREADAWHQERERQRDRESLSQMSCETEGGGGGSGGAATAVEQQQQ
ncbi:hypothetical protein Vretimale_8532, partial [Volvox reticuliferus]